MSEQITFLGKEYMTNEQIADLVRQVECFKDYEKTKRNWENGFQRWSDKHGMEKNNTTSYGCCGYGSMCDYCEDNSYGRPCVRALNAMIRDKHMKIDYNDRNYERIWFL